MKGTIESPLKPARNGDAGRGSPYLCDVNDGSVGGPDKHGPVVVDVDDCNDQVCGAPQRGTALIRGHHRQVESL